MFGCIRIVDMITVHLGGTDQTFTVSHNRDKPFHETVRADCLSYANAWLNIACKVIEWPFVLACRLHSLLLTRIHASCF